MSKLVGAILVIVAGCGTGLASPALTSTPKPTALAPAAASPRTIPTPQQTLFGEFPGADATVPPGQPVIESLRFAELAGLWASLGLSCFSHVSGGPESAANHNVDCEGGDVATNAEVVVEADYWTLNAVAAMSVSVRSITMDGSVDHEATASEWVFPFAALAGGDSAVAWVKDHLDDDACGLGCSEAIGNSDLSYYNGTRGGHQLYFVVRIPVRSS
jgi:hypothetical protein